MLAQAKWHLRQTQIKFQETNKKIDALEKIEQDYMRQARRLKRLIDNDLQNWRIFLNSGNKVGRSKLPNDVDVLDVNLKLDIFHKNFRG